MKKRSILSLGMLSLAIMAPAQAMQSAKSKFWTPARVASLYHAASWPTTILVGSAGIFGWSAGFLHGAIKTRSLAEELATKDLNFYKSQYREKGQTLENIVDKSACPKEYDAWKASLRSQSSRSHEEITNAYFKCRNQFLEPFRPKA